MSLFDPFKFRGIKYKTAREVQRAKEAHTLDIIKNKRGVRGWLGNFFMSKRLKEKYDIK